MKKFFLFLIFSCCVGSLKSQSEPIDNLKKALQKEDRDTNRVYLLERMSFAFLRSKPDTALALAQEGLSLSEKIGFEKGEAICLNRIGTVLRSTGNYPLALEKLLKALKINERINNRDGIMRNLGNIGNVLSNQGDFREALNYSFREKIIAEEDNNEELLILTLLSIGDSYEKISPNLLDSARIFTHQAYELALKVKNNYYIGTALNNLGNIHSKMIQSIIAMEYYKLAFYYYEMEDDEEGICETALGIARLFRNSGSSDSALYYAKRSLRSATIGGFTRYLFEASQFLTDYYKTHNNVDSAFKYQELLIKANDSLYSQEKTKKLNDLAFNENLRQQEIAKEKEKAAEERRNNWELMIIAIVSVLAFLILMLLFKKNVKVEKVEAIGLIWFLLLFEFIAFILHPHVAEWTGHKPIFMILILVFIAWVLELIHHYLEGIVKKRFAKKIV
jgi:tetratricopeptide (TPR) repeat protein